MTMRSSQNLNHLQSTMAMCFANSNEAVMLLDSKHHIIFISPAIAKIDQQLQNKLLNNSFLSLLVEADKVNVWRLLNELNRENKPSVTLYTQLCYPGGHQFWVNLTFTINTEVEEQVVFVNINPIDQHIGVQKPILENGNISLLESVVANINDAVIIIELAQTPARTSKIIYVNKAFPSLTGYTFSELQGNSPRFLQASLTNQNYFVQLKKSIHQGKAFENTLPCYKKNGDLYWANASFSPLKNENGLVNNWIIILRDVTEKKELEQVFRKASSLARIGSWAYEIESQKIYWSEMTMQIYEVKPDFEPSITTTIPFFKYAKQNQLILDQISADITAGKAFDLEVEILTAKRNKKWIRIIGEPEILNGKCHKISGSFQDIDQRKRAQLFAERTNNEKNAIFESIADGFFAVDRKWRITFWNTKAAQEVKRSKEELMHQNLWEVFAEAIGSYSYHQYYRAMKLKQVTHFESFSNVTAQWYDISVYPSANGLSVYFKNITARKLEQKLLIDTEKRYRDLFQLSPLPKWIFDLETLRFLDVNKAAINHYGYSYKQFMKMTILDIRPSEEHEKLTNTLKQSNTRQKVLHQGLFTHQKKNGALIRVNIQSVPLVLKGRKAKLIIADDVTEQQQYIKAIEKQNQTLKEVSWINSHILRAPLTKIMGLLEVAKIVDEHQERKVILDYIQTAANELDKAVMEITNRSKTNNLNN
jgi:PAS domain S-box-containing protein